MDAVKEDIEKLVQKELKAANEKFPLFASNHEGYAVIKEEVEEAKEQLSYVKQMLDALWVNAKRNSDSHTERFAKELQRCAINLACEAIQVAAMAQKFIDSAKSREDKIK